ncbi:OmpA family protein [Streptomyces sp. TRM43335]|uniref:OmpA family protein n=1 Tax=Streptomyces taklimakanensis TaxID=2569853 RepID=A0A6G2BFE0_9ACTN|nr:OmpA family protein [Streptomyces taklimakanensis]MTE20789.1 OmpA family protein [Streptomyces taklimakanensis]
MIDRPRTPTARRTVAVGAGALLAVSVLTVTATGAAHADPGPSAPSDFIPSPPPPVEVDQNAPGLMMKDGATLKEPKVLDIRSIVEEQGGAERREDSNTQTKFTLQAEVLFDKDSARLNGEAYARIEDIAEEIDKQGAAEVNVFGFTDNLGSYEHGTKLSKERAEAVHGQLMKKLSSDVTFHIRGYSEDYPIADNSTEEGRKKNRRVEVSFPRGG